MKITKKGAELFHPQFLVVRLQTIFHELRKERPQSVKLESSQSENDRPRNNSGKGCHQTDTLYFSSLSHNPENSVEICRTWYKMAKTAQLKWLPQKWRFEASLSQD